MSLLAVALLLAAAPAAPPAASKADVRKKQAVAASIDARRRDLASLADQVWAFAETALRETRSAALLADYAEKQGFRVERGVAGMPTAFVASYGQGRPVIAVLGEYDALPGLSQKAVPERAVLQAGAPGHGCGHNLFGAASLGAAIAVKKLIAVGKLSGTERYYGTPAEEAIGGKVHMAREGLFRDVDVALAWHPADRTRADMRSGQALADMIVEFKGRTAHAAFDPWNGRSAVDALELFTHGASPTARRPCRRRSSGQPTLLAPRSLRRAVSQELEVGPKRVAHGEDPDDAVVLENGQAVDPVGEECLHRFPREVVRTDGQDVPRHDPCERSRLQEGLVFLGRRGRERAGQRALDVAIGHDPHELPAPVQHRDVPDPADHDDLDRLTKEIVIPEGDRVSRHEVPDARVLGHAP